MHAKSNVPIRIKVAKKHVGVSAHELKSSFIASAIPTQSLYQLQVV